MEKNKLIFVIIFILALLTTASFFVFGKSNKKMIFERESQQEISQETAQKTPEETRVEDENDSAWKEETATQDKQKLQQTQKSVEDEEKKQEPQKTDTKKDSARIENRLMSSGFATSSGRKIDTVVIHSSYNSLGGDEYDVNKIIDIYESYGVSAHYIISRDGKIIRLVEEKNIAYHAGESKVPDGRTNANAFSVGIEMVGNKTDGYTEKQYDALTYLVGVIKEKYNIKYVLGHSDIASGRKDDPWNFDWNKLK